MYIARITINRKIHYILRETCKVGNTLSYRNIFEMGSDPTQFIIYPGGNAYYFSSVILERLDALGIRHHDEELEDLFWPFLRPDIKRSVAHFRHRSKFRKNKTKLSDNELKIIQKSVHPFDKRRAHFLRLGNMDQGMLERMPPALYQHLAAKSRDEIEQHFMVQEQRLKATELKTYVYTAFNLQRFFSSIIALKMPQGLNQLRVDEHFLEEICRINREIFSVGEQQSARDLNDYLVRYLVMFFDHDYENSALLDDYVNDFIYRHHFFKPDFSDKPIRLDKAGKIFGVKKEALEAMAKPELTRMYRRLAQKLHPDKGGSKEKFIELTETYEGLLRKLY